LTLVVFDARVGPWFCLDDGLNIDILGGSLYALTYPAAALELIFMLLLYLLFRLIKLVGQLQNLSVGVHLLTGLLPVKILLRIHLLFNDFNTNN
jgi:hypothetical protein